MATDGRQAELGQVDRGEDDQQRQDRQGDDAVGDAHQQIVEPAAEIAGHNADGGADDRREDGGHQPDQQRNPAAVEQAHQQVAAEFVGAQRVRQARALEDRAQVDVADIGAQQTFDRGRKGGGQDEDDEDDGRGHGEPVAQEAAQNPQP